VPIRLTGAKKRTFIPHTTDWGLVRWLMEALSPLTDVLAGLEAPGLKTVLQAAALDLLGRKPAVPICLAHWPSVVSCRVVSCRVRVVSVSVLCVVSCRVVSCRVVSCRVCACQKKRTHVASDCSLCRSFFV
jgi:hypothetical protein